SGRPLAARPHAGRRPEHPPARALRAPPRARNPASGGDRRGARDRQAFLDAQVLAVHQRDPGRRPEGASRRGPRVLSAPRGRIVFLAAALVVSTALLRADESAVYRASGPDSRLFDQYDNDGYSMTVAPRSDGSLELLVRVSDGPLESRAPYPTAGARDVALPVSPERDAFARTLAGDAAT